MPETSIAVATTPFAAPADAVELIGRSNAIVRVQEFVRRAASFEGGVLIAAEEGSSADSLARELHARGRHAAGPFVEVNCADPDVTRLERALFGTSANES